MPILDLQRRARELGRIRIGQVVPTRSGKTRPEKLDRFRITAHSRELITRVAELYGGEPTEWQPQGNGPAGWEVITTSTRLPILVPPQPVTQWLELWSGGGCQRRCDGVREVLSDSACICGPDPAARRCRPTTRLNVVLREVEGIGVFRLETHGYYAAVELPMAAELLAQAGGYISGHLGLEERVVVRDSETRRFMVPTIDVDLTPAQLLTGAGGAPGQLGAAQQREVPAPEQRAALPAGPPARKPAMSEAQLDMLLDQIRGVPNLDQLTELSRGIATDYDVDPAGPIPQACRARAQELQRAQQQVDTQTGQPQMQTAPVEEDGDPDELWSKIMRSVPEDWTTTQVEHEFAQFAQVPADQAGAADMRRYLDHLAEEARTAKAAS